MIIACNKQYKGYIMNVSSTSYMQQSQVRKMDGTGGGQGNGMGRMMKETLSMLPKETQADIKSLMQQLEPSDRKNTMMKMAEIETSNMTVEDLTAAIMDIFQPGSTEEKSSYPGSFSTYA